MVLQHYKTIIQKGKCNVRKEVAQTYGFCCRFLYNTPVQVPAENQSTEKSKKNSGGRPKKDGLKNEQFTLTMNPETYEKLKIIAYDYTRGNFSALIDEAIKVYCKEKNIDLSKIEIDDSKLDIYRKRQEKKASKKK